MTSLKVPLTKADHSLGHENALVTLVEYGDYECPYCGLAHPVVKRLRAHYGKDLRFAFRHFPFLKLIPTRKAPPKRRSLPAHTGISGKCAIECTKTRVALTCRCSSRLPRRWVSPDLALLDALARGEYTPKVRNHFVGGVKSGVNGTPTLFIEGQRHDGALDFDSLAAAIDSWLGQTNHAGARKGGMRRLVIQ